MGTLTDDQIKRALADADVHLQAQRTPPVETLLLGCDIDVGEKTHPNGTTTKMLVFRHRSGLQQWVVELPLAGAQAVAKELSKPPRITSMVNGDANP